MIFLEYPVSREGNINFNWIFHDSLMSMIPTFRKNFSSKCRYSIFYKFLCSRSKIQRNGHNFEKRSKGTTSCRRFLISLGLVYEQNMSPNGANHLEMFPQYKSLKTFLYTHSRLQKRGFDIKSKSRFTLFHEYDLGTWSTR